MILRIVTGAFERDPDASDLADLRRRLGRMAGTVAGLESLILGLRSRPGVDRPESALISVWRDAEAMVRATSVDEQDRFLGARLRLALELERAEHYEIVTRTFAALPPDGTAFIRIVRVLSRRNEEQLLVDTLRRQQPRLVKLGLIASHIGRRVIGSQVEAVSVGVWPDRGSSLAATTGGPDAPLFAEELATWAERAHVEMYDGIEIAPRLPDGSGPAILLLDDDLRIVDVTAAAAATVGWTAHDLVGVSLGDLAHDEVGSLDARLSALPGSEPVATDATWLVPESGEVYLRVIARRDAPIPGRHAILVRRVSDPPPTVADLDRALELAFPTITLRASGDR